MKIAGKATDPGNLIGKEKDDADQDDGCANPDQQASEWRKLTHHNFSITRFMIRVIFGSASPAVRMIF